MDILLLVIFSIQLRKLALVKGESPLSWILKYVFTWLVFVLVLTTLMVARFGVDFVEQPIFWQVMPVLLFMNFFVFAFYRAMLLRKPDPVEPEPPAEEKDLSYFR